MWKFVLESVASHIHMLQWIKDFGKFPSRRLALTSSDSIRVAVKFFKHGGMEPLKRLLDKSKYSNRENLQSQWGNGPRNEFEFRSNRSI